MKRKPASPNADSAKVSYDPTCTCLCRRTKKEKRRKNFLLSMMCTQVNMAKLPTNGRGCNRGTAAHNRFSHLLGRVDEQSETLLRHNCDKDDKKDASGKTRALDRVGHAHNAAPDNGIDEIRGRAH